MEDRKRGSVLVWVAAFVSLFVAILGLGCDWGYVLLVVHQLQNAADAAALAAAQQVSTDQVLARDAAIAVAHANKAANETVELYRNDGNAAEGDIVVGNFDRDTQVFTPGTTGPNAVKVVARRTTGSLGGPLPLIFAPIYGVNSSELARSGIAMIGGGTGDGLIILEPTDSCAIKMSGSAGVYVEGGSIQVDSSHNCAVCNDGGNTIGATEMNVVGDAACMEGTFTGTLNPGADAIPDPLAALVPPTPGADLGTRNISGGTVTLSPGYYSGGIKISGGSLTCLPGIYIVAGSGLQRSGSASITAEGVMFYITGAGSLVLTGSGALTITPPDPDLYSYPGVDTYEGISIFQDRSNTKDARITGSSGMDLQGTLYLPSTKLKLTGSSTAIGNRVIVDKLDLTGSGVFTVDYAGRSSGDGNHVFLVK